MKKLFTFFTVLSAVVCLQSCSDEKPYASFSISKSEVCVNENVSFINTSINAWYCEWDFGDGHTSTKWTPSHKYTIPGNHVITLTAWSEKRKKQDMASQIIYVGTGKGDVMFWVNEDQYDEIKVKLMGEEKWITCYYSSGKPTCGAKGCATYWNVPVGSHYFAAKNSLYSWSGYINVFDGRCCTMLLY